jgi:signal transduction histidine kinase
VVLLFGAGWIAFGRRGEESPAAARVFTGITIVAAGAGTAFVPPFALIQTIAFPIVWVLAANLRSALVANVALALSVGAGFLISTGTAPDELVQTAATVLISLGFSLAMGLWITRIWKLSDERLALVEQLTAAQDEVVALSKEAGIASERERLARELHDTIAQDLTAMVLLTQRARRELGHDRATEAIETLQTLEETARGTLAETRALVAVHARVELPGGGIVPALQRLAENFERETGIVVTVDAAGVPELPRDAEVVLLRCAQEALANVRKHAGAHRVGIRLGSAPHAVQLLLRDDGGGFDPTTATGGFGLGGMRDRLDLVQGRLEVASGPDGTTLTVSLPVPVHA